MKLGLYLSMCTVCVFGWLVSDVYCVDCLDKSAVQKAMLRCFSHWRITLDTRFIEVWNIIQTDPATACRRRDNFMDAYTCASEIWRECIVKSHFEPLDLDVPADLDERYDLLPDPDELGEAIDYVCFYLKEYDVECAQRVQLPILECADAESRTELLKPMLVRTIMSVVEQCDDEGKAEKMAQYSDPKYMICKTFEMAHNCTVEHMSECSARTQKVATTLTGRYLLPPACKSQETPDKEDQEEEDWKMLEHQRRHEEL